MKLQILKFSYCNFILHACEKRCVPAVYQCVCNKSSHCLVQFIIRLVRYFYVLMRSGPFCTKVQEFFSAFYNENITISSSASQHQLLTEHLSASNCDFFMLTQLVQQYDICLIKVKINLDNVEKNRRRQIRSRLR